MKIILSIATSSDCYLDDNSPERLVLSTAEDWAAVYALRGSLDAILIGGETLRRDNPSLGLKGDVAGRAPLRVVVSGRGEISRDAKIFHKGDAGIVIFSNIERKELTGLADVVVAERVDLPLIVTELEKRGVKSLLVEGGAKILDMFLCSGEVNELRWAVQPNIVVNDTSAPRFVAPEWLSECDKSFVNLGGMEVTTYNISSNNELSERDVQFMARAVEVSEQSPERDSCYRVGSVVETLNGEVFDGYTLESAPTHHAEQVALYKALAAGADLLGATIYASMEPCSSRKSEPESCSELIMKYGLKRVLFALYEPSHFVECHGAENLRRAGVEVCCVESFAKRVREINSHVLGSTEE